MLIDLPVRRHFGSLFYNEKLYLPIIINSIMVHGFLSCVNLLLNMMADEQLFLIECSDKGFIIIV